MSYSATTLDKRACQLALWQKLNIEFTFSAGLALQRGFSRQNSVGASRDVGHEGGVSPAARADYQWRRGAAWSVAGCALPLTPPRRLAASPPPPRRPATAESKRLHPRINLALMETGSGERR
ncbi:hypothetical protein O0L34_g16557 [Tuta absoluta]|nr:hypothetical protein O0L34_g16557 [Tuta absoluta]